jgi:hypothetical protein
VANKREARIKKISLESVTSFGEAEMVMLRLSEVSRRLRESELRTRRLVAEQANISPEDYIARLRKTKAHLAKDVQRLFAKKFSVGTTRSPGALFIPLDQGTSGREQRYGFRKGRIVLPDTLPVLHGMAAADQAGGTCVAFEDLLSGVPLIGENRSDIHHDSTAGIAVDLASRDFHGVAFARAYLNDDAAFWRDDNPDRYSCSYVEEWAFPPAPCDMLVLCRIDCSQRIQFIDTADEYGWARCAVLPQWTDENGVYHAMDVSRDGLITFESGSSGSADSRRFAVLKTFPVQAGKLSWFRLHHFMDLWAQDGQVEVLGTFQTNQRDEVDGPPILWFMMIPQDSSCFITTTICDVLKKPDDCDELQRLRAFRDGYLMERPDGQALISDYYYRAPRLLAALGTGPRRDAALRAAYDRYLIPCLQAIERGAYARALAIYGNMVRELEREVAR